MSKTQDTSYVFTFSGDDPIHKNTAIRIYGTFETSRRKMFDLYGDNWAFQYSYQEWCNLVQTHKNNNLPIEKIVDTI